MRYLLKPFARHPVSPSEYRELAMDGALSRGYPFGLIAPLSLYSLGPRPGDLYGRAYVLHDPISSLHPKLRLCAAHFSGCDDPVSSIEDHCVASSSSPYLDMSFTRLAQCRHTPLSHVSGITPFVSVDLSYVCVRSVSMHARRGTEFNEELI